MLKQLPPSDAELRLLDVGAVCGAVFAPLRPDVLALPASLRPQDWRVPAQSLDAITAYDHLPTPEFLSASLNALRDGGRLVVVLPFRAFDVAYGKTLESAGFVRILIEPALDGEGVLLRGERAHKHTNTQDRVKEALLDDAPVLTLDTYRGRFVHFLVTQTPNKPVWRITPNDRIEWHALASEGRLLAFTSLPKSVSFMQEAVLKGIIHNINKVPKYKKEVVQAWETAVWLNPDLNALTLPLQSHPLNPSSAEQPDE